MSLLHNVPGCFTEKKHFETTIIVWEVKHKSIRFMKYVLRIFCFLVLILTNSLKNTCKGFHFCSNIAGWKHKTLRNWSSSQVFRIFSKFREGLSEFGGIPIKYSTPSGPFNNYATFFFFQHHSPICNAS